MKKLIPLLAAPAALVGTAHAATVENVRAQQRPRANVVEVCYDLVAPEGGVWLRAE